MVFLILFLLLVVINAYFSATEIAIVSSKKFRLQKEADKGNENAKQILGLLQNPEEYLSSIQVGITLVGIIEGLYGGEYLVSLLEPRFIASGMSQWSAHTLSVALGIGLITYFAIVVGELIPKSIALLFPQEIALGVAPSFRLFTLMTYPFVKLLTESTHFILRLLGIHESENQKLSDSDLKSLLSLAYRQGTLEKNELLMHENIFNFYDRTIENIMTPFEKLIVIEETMTTEVVVNIIQKSNHNYYPVVRQKNKIIGYIKAKDAYKEIGIKLHQITYPACTIEGNQSAPELLQRFKERNHNFGMVSGKAGELTGVVTMHDIAAILVGKTP